MNVQIFEGAGVEVIPCGVPARLIFGHLVWQRNCSEIVAEGREMADKGNLVSADRNQKAIAVGMLVDVSGEVLRCGDPRVLRVKDIAEGPYAIEGRCAESDGQNCDAG